MCTVGITINQARKPAISDNRKENIRERVKGPCMSRPYSLLESNQSGLVNETAAMPVGM